MSTRSEGNRILRLHDVNRKYAKYGPCPHCGMDVGFQGGTIEVRPLPGSHTAYFRLAVQCNQCGIGLLASGVDDAERGVRFLGIELFRVSLFTELVRAFRSK